MGYYTYLCSGKLFKRRERISFPSVFQILKVNWSMTTENKLKPVEDIVQQMLSDYPEFFCVNLKIKPTNNIKVFIDGDQGISIEKCVMFNRELYKLIEAAALFPEGEFSLEVSSPGIDEPLKQHRQYVKNTGRLVEVILNDDTTVEGKLMLVNETGIQLQTTEGKGKKKEVKDVDIAFENIKSTTVQIQF